jgi:hypothetical protein
MENVKIDKKSSEIEILMSLLCCSETAKVTFAFWPVPSLDSFLEAI